MSTHHPPAGDDEPTVPRPPLRGGTPWRVIPEGRPPEWKPDGYAVVTADWDEMEDRPEHYVAERMTRETAELLVSAAAPRACEPTVPRAPVEALLAEIVAMEELDEITVPPSLNAQMNQVRRHLDTTPHQPEEGDHA